MKESPHIGRRSWLSAFSIDDKYAAIRTELLDFSQQKSNVSRAPFLSLLPEEIGQPQLRGVLRGYELAAAAFAEHPRSRGLITEAGQKFLAAHMMIVDALRSDDCRHWLVDPLLVANTIRMEPKSFGRPLSAYAPVLSTWRYHIRVPAFHIVTEVPPILKTLMDDLTGDGDEAMDDFEDWLLVLDRGDPRKWNLFMLGISQTQPQLGYQLDVSMPIHDALDQAEAILAAPPVDVTRIPSILRQTVDALSSTHGIQRLFRKSLEQLLMYIAYASLTRDIQPVTGTTSIVGQRVLEQGEFIPMRPLSKADQELRRKFGGYS